MKPVIVSHPDYRRFLSGVGGMYRINWRSYPPAVREIYIRFRELDLSAVDRIMQDQYSNRGPESRQPSCMLRSLLLMIVMNVVSITRWVETLHTSQFFAILSGFQPWDIPGVGTFYDFIDKLWNLATPNFSSHIKPPAKQKVKKPKGKGQKAASIEKESVAELIARLSQVTFHTDKEAYGLLFRIFRTCFLDESIRRGKVNPARLNIAGDGTPVVTAARFRSHHICDCWKTGNFNCDCNRYFPQPDCSIGWDSSRDCWYFGYDLYILTDADSDLSLFPLYHAASKHDSHGFCEAFFRFRALAPDLTPASKLIFIPACFIGHIILYTENPPRPYLFIPGMPEQPDADHNIPFRRQSFLRFHENILEPGAFSLIIIPEKHLFDIFVIVFLCSFKLRPALRANHPVQRNPKRKN